MAIPPDGAFELGKAALQTLNNLTAIVLKSKEGKGKDGKESRLSYSDTIKHMGADIHARAIELRTELRDMDKNLATLRDRGYNIDMPLAEVRKQGWFYRIALGAPYKMLRNFGTRIAGIANQTEDIFADVLSVANCREAEEEVAEAVAKAKEVMASLKGAATSTAPMSKVIAEMLAEADALVKLTDGL